MFGYIARRLVQLVFVLIGVSIITFLIMFLIPGDPAYLLAGKNATPERVQQIRVKPASTGRSTSSTSSSSDASPTVISASRTSSSGRSAAC